MIRRLLYLAPMREVIDMAASDDVWHMHNIDMIRESCILSVHARFDVDSAKMFRIFGGVISVIQGETDVQAH